MILKYATQLFDGPEAYLLTVLGINDKNFLKVAKPLLLLVFSIITLIIIGELGDSKEFRQIKILL